MHLADAQFQRDGFCHLPGALTAQAMGRLQALLPAMERFKQDRKDPNATLWFMHEDIKDLKEIFEHPPLLAKLAREVRSAASPIKLLATTLYTKSPGQEGTPWHQDGRFIPSDTLQAISLWVPLHPINLDQAPLVFLPRSQNQCMIDQPIATITQAGPIPAGHPVVAAPLALGDATLHQLWTMHGSLKNNWSGERQALIVNYLKAPLKLNPNANPNANSNVGGGAATALINQIRQSHFETLQRHAG